MGFHSVVVSLDLRADVLHRERGRKVLLLVEIVKAEVYGKRYGGVVRQFGINHLQRRAARPSVGKEIAVAAVNYDVFRCKLAQHTPLGVCLVHLSVVHVLHGEGSRVAFAEGVYILCAHPRRAAGVGHKVQSGRLARHVGIERGVSPACRRRVLHERVVHAAERGHVHRHRQPHGVE